MDKPDPNENVAIGLIPARGGSKSIPLKNIVPIEGRPLIAYVISAAKRAKLLTRVVCSTDHEVIASVCHEHGVDVINRPSELGADDTPIVDVVRHVLSELGRTGSMPGIVALLQPTSPFILPAHIDACIAALRSNPEADSAQTITPVVHNAHAFNQRVVVDGKVDFRFKAERQAAYNKQRKPKHYVFGNLVVTRSRALLAGRDCFGDISLAVEIPRPYALDVDTPEDIEFATYLVREAKVPGCGP